jgi:carboxyl-terminal processing protease
MGSIGAVLSHDRASGKVVVRDAPQGMSGAKGGLQPGDEIVLIDGRDVRDMDTADVQEALRGDVGSPVSLTVVRGADVVRLSVKRGPFRKPKRRATEE